MGHIRMGLIIIYGAHQDGLIIMGQSRWVNYNGAHQDGQQNCGASPKRVIEYITGTGLYSYRG